MPPQSAALSGGNAHNPVVRRAVWTERRRTFSKDLRPQSPRTSGPPLPVKHPSVYNNDLKVARNAALGLKAGAGRKEGLWRHAIGVDIEGPVCSCHRLTLRRL